uniref:BEACH-type PH domain-containing protein n=1 Tax=Syphacia muris TaxID=451379 RepID=A0A0N5B0I0_9BILA
MSNNGVEHLESNAGKSFENENSVDEVTQNVGNTTVIHSSEETPEETFKRLAVGLKNDELMYKDVLDSTFNALVGGAFDIESKFIIENPENIVLMVKLLDNASERLQAEVWSVFVGVVRKSNRNLEACSRIGLISLVLDRLSNSGSVVSDLLVQLLGVLTSYSISVKETKHFLRVLRASNGHWQRNATKLLNVLEEMPKRDGADVFFSFPGTTNSGIALPPLTKWPYQNGWTFSTWLRMDPLNSVNFEKERPFVYCFRINKGLGYSCYFTGNCLVVSSIRSLGKETARCIRYELTPRKWHHIAISHVYSREIQCFIDGQLIETFDVTWLVSTTDQFDRCSIGCGPDGEEPFCGQMAALYVFAEAITLQQANSLFCLGAAYQSSFRHDAESDLPDDYKKHLFDGRLSSSLIIAYCPKNCDGQLCLHSSPKMNASYFVQVPHAIMKQGVEVVTTHSIHSSLHSVGGIQILLPLFAQLDLPLMESETVDYNLCATLLSAISLLLGTSPSAQQQLLHSKGFLIISYMLSKSSFKHLTDQVLDILIGISKFLLASSSGLPLLKQLFDHILFNPPLWRKAPMQIRLYEYLSNDFLNNPHFLSIFRRNVAVVEILHTIKYYYWVVPARSPSSYSTRPYENKVEKSDVVIIRSYLLRLISRLVVANDNKSGDDVNCNNEFNSILNFIATVYEDDNLYDILSLTTTLLSERPAQLVPAFDRKKGLSVVFKLLNSPNELIRVPALKIFGYFLCRSTIKRKNDAVGNLNVLTLLTERLLLHAKYLTMATYNVLFEMMVEQMTPMICYTPHSKLTGEERFENPILLKVIANLIAQSEKGPELLKVKKLFLEDMLYMCETSRENRRTILQMSVWQEWLISLVYVFPVNEEEAMISELVFRIFGKLLFHAIRLEYGGWRVWVDTLAIAHSKVKKRVIEDHQPPPIYRTPEFRWSSVHLRLLSDLLGSIDEVVCEWKKKGGSLLDAVNSSENSVFVANVVHVLSQLSDSLVMACGGLLPLLAEATSTNSAIDIVDSSSQGLSIGDAAQLLTTFALLADIFVFISGTNFSELEQEKNMPSGGILRQALRLGMKFLFFSEENRQAQFLALAITYLISVLMVSRYRDILEPPSSPSPFFDTAKTRKQSEGNNSTAAVTENVLTERNLTENAEAGNHNEEETANTLSSVIAAIEINEKNDKILEPEYDEGHLKSLSNITSKSIETGERREYLTTKLQKALETTAPLLREIMTDFRGYLQKTLLGTHGQEIMNDVKVMETLKNQQGSVIELVMLLCSQEWQTSLQKHAGLAFIELVNEGRLMAHATREHVLRVANEADFILNRLGAEDVSKHGQFEGEAAEQAHRRMREEAMNDHLITASRRRDVAVAARLLDKMKTILMSPGGIFWKLDIWEDDSRRRKRFIPNPYLCRYTVESLKPVLQNNISAEEVKLLRDLVARRLVSLGSLKTGSALSELVDESDIDKWATEPDAPEVAYSTFGRLIAPGIVVPGTLSVTGSELYFDADEEHPLYKQQDPKVGFFFRILQRNSFHIFYKFIVRSLTLKSEILLFVFMYNAIAHNGLLIAYH